MFCVDCIDTADIFIGAGVVATLAGVVVALILGVGGWRRDARIREAERAENRLTFATLLAHDVRRLQIQARDARGFLEEARFGPEEGDEDYEGPVNVFLNPFGAEHGALMVLSPLSVMDRSAEWAKHLPHDVVKVACALSNFERGWNEKARLLEQFPKDKVLPADLSDDLVFILDRIEEKASELLPRLNDLAGQSVK